MVATRRSGGGRKPTVLPNPFVLQDDWGDPYNVLWETEFEVDIRIEDILVGCVRAFNEDHKNKKQSIVNWMKLLRVYRNVWELSTKYIATYLRCSESHAAKYMQVIKLTNPFLYKYMKGESGTNICGYIDLPLKQVKSGYKPFGDKSKEGVVETNKQEIKSCLTDSIKQLRLMSEQTDAG